MKSDIECLFCLMKQAFNTVQIATPDRALQRKVLNRTAQWIEQANLNETPAAISTVVYRIVSEVTGIKDPYDETKKRTNLEALSLLPELKPMITAAKDPLDVALHLAVAGNMIDMGIGHDFDLKRDIKRIVETPFAIDHTDSFRKELKPDHRLLYIGDNSGEIVFDRLLIEILLDKGLDITYVVKSGPIINDAMIEDARVAGITDLVRVIETGSDDVGIRFEKMALDLKQALEHADFILAKGQGNYESCDEWPHRFYFLLKAKCDVVAKALKVQKNDIVFKLHAST